MVAHHEERRHQLRMRLLQHRSHWTWSFCCLIPYPEHTSWDKCQRRYLISRTCIFRTTILCSSSLDWMWSVEEHTSTQVILYASLIVASLYHWRSDKYKYNFRSVLLWNTSWRNDSRGTSRSMALHSLCWHGLCHLLYLGHWIRQCQLVLEETLLLCISLDRSFLVDITSQITGPVSSSDSSYLLFICSLGQRAMVLRGRRRASKRL